MKLTNFFKDKHGKVVIAEAPNVLILGWMACVVVGWLFPVARYAGGIHQLGTALLFTWAYLELCDGCNGFRKTLGGVVMAYILYGFFA